MNSPGYGGAGALHGRTQTGSNPANGGVAAHLPQCREVLSNKKRPRTGSRGGERRFRTGVTASYYDDIKLIIGRH